MRSIFSRPFLVVVLLASMLLIFASPVSAHATPVSYRPEASSVLIEPPDEIRIYFSERIEENASSIRIFDPNGSPVETKKAYVDSTDHRYFVAPLPPIAEGTYTISWQVVSADDGHFTKGAFSFSVGEQTGSGVLGQIQVQHVTKIPQATAISLELVGQALLLGSFLVLSLIWRPVKGRFEKHQPFQRGIYVLVLLGVLSVLSGAVSFVLIKTFDLQQLRTTGFTDTLVTFLGTTDGKHALARAALAVIYLVSFLALRKAIFKSSTLTKGEVFLLFVFSLMILSRARVSHAAASHFLPLFSILVNAVHLLAKEAWVGTVLVFSLLISPVIFKIKQKEILQRSLTLLSRLIIIAFATAGITGVYIIWLHAKHPEFFLTTEWGQLAALLFVVAFFLFVPRLYQIFIGQRLEGKFLSASSYLLPLEALVGVVLLLVTSAIIITTPPYPSERIVFSKQNESQGARINFSVHPLEQNLFLVTVEDIKGKEADVDDLIVKLANTKEGIGPLIVDAEKRFLGGYVFPREQLSLPGEWKLDITARRAGSYDSVASFTLNYPNDLDKATINFGKRRFSVFEIIGIMGILGIVAFSLVLNKVNSSSGFGRLLVVNYSTFRAWGSSFVGLVVTLLLTAAVWQYGIKTDFQRLCERNGDFWLQSVPMRNYQALSSETVTGCTLEFGFYHFGDKREYKHFVRPAEVLAELSTTPEEPRAGDPIEMALSLSTLEDGQKKGSLDDIGIYHDRIIHAVVVGEDLETFAHIHPEDLGPITEEMISNASFPLKYTFPKAGRYLIAVDFVSHGYEYQRELYVDVEGEQSMRTRTTDFSRIKEVDGYKVTLHAPEGIKAKENVHMSYYIEKNGRPVADIEPYLAAAMHIGSAREDLGKFTHTHGEVYLPGSTFFQKYLQGVIRYHTHFVPDKFGPTIDVGYGSPLIFPTHGVYKIFGEFKHNGKPIVTEFMVKVE